MNEEWSNKNKQLQQLLKKATFKDGINELLVLRNMLMKEMLLWKDELEVEDFWASPFINAKGYHCKTIAYSLWHIFRIEDIVVHTLIKDDEQIFFEGDYKKRMNASIITTGNELVKEQIVDFSRALDINVLYEYICAVKTSTDKWLSEIDYPDLKIKFEDLDRDKIDKLNVVSKDENAIWLIEYWCGKNVKGLIQMPLSRHWIIHIEASLKIKNKIQGNHKTRVN